MSKQLAIIKEVGYGCRDVGRPVLWFTVSTCDCGCALQVLSGKEADALIRDYGVYDVQELNGKPCFVEVGRGTMLYAGKAEA